MEVAAGKKRFVPPHGSGWLFGGLWGGGKGTRAKGLADVMMGAANGRGRPVCCN